MKVRCKKWKTCNKQCGASIPHDDSSCEPCPFYPSAKCQPACRECGCTDDDCSQCVAATGKPCHWVEPDLCSRCKDEMDHSADIAAEVDANIEYPEINEFQIQGPGAAR